MQATCAAGMPGTYLGSNRGTASGRPKYATAANGTMASQSIEIDERTAASVMLVSGGYPGAYENGMVITGFETIENSILFHAGTKFSGEDVVTAGGRVLAISSYGNSMKEALEQSYINAEKINFDKKYYRKDLGFDL